MKKDKPDINQADPKTEVTLNKGHRTTDFRREYVEIAERLVSAGFTLADLAFAFNVNSRTITNWKRKHKDFKRACNQGKEIVKKKLVAAGIKQALGYNYESSKTEHTTDKDGNPKVKRVVFNQHQAGNHNLLTFLLLNISRQDGTHDWVVPKQIMETKNQTVNLKIDGQIASDAISKLAGKLLEDKPVKQVESKQIDN